MAIKNAYTTAPLNNIVVAIQKSLLTHKAQKIMYDYSPTGELIGLSFGIELNGNIIGVKLPAKIKECEAVMREQGVLNTNRTDHALRVAWANIRDWVDSQMAMIDLDMVKLEEVFLPYIMQGNKTVFELYQQKFNSLPEGNKNDE